MFKNINNMKHYSHDQTVPSHSRCQNDRDNHTNVHAGYDHDHDT